ncbi:hypothetical protein BLA28_19465 [Eisenbergiella tayi]|uniref:nucleotidyltransferase domain-containing protein n=1 Tax=Eisenbergiella tayi TaxID=1432052 RepID=UPI0008FD015E|nr:nucleotidyltransferase domain-containing protein [Eisenbergiella tayi]OIZ62586.1 hypothetical protein BLA28_19465 [Eisenbergiella tayi]
MPIKILYEIKSVLEKTPYFNCDSCFLRGSFLTNEYKDISDIDLLVVSNDFKYMSYLKRQELIQRTFEKMNINIIIDAICLSKEEYAQLIYEKRQMLKDERMEKII